MTEGGPPVCPLLATIFTAAGICQSSPSSQCAGVSVFSSVCPSPVSFLLCQVLFLRASVFPVPYPLSLPLHFSATSFTFLLSGPSGTSAF